MVEWAAVEMPFPERLARRETMIPTPRREDGHCWQREFRAARAAAARADSAV
jgi:hypothetical protein